MKLTSFVTVFTLIVIAITANAYAGKGSVSPQGRCTGPGEPSHLKGEIGFQC